MALPSSQLLYLHRILCAHSHISFHIFYFNLSSHLAILLSSPFVCPDHSASHYSPQFFSPPSSCYLLSHKTYLHLILLSVCLRDSDCVIFRMSQQVKACMDMCVCAYDYKRGCAQVCVLSCPDVCETGVIELRGFSVFGGRGEIGIFRIH